MKRKPKYRRASDQVRSLTRGGILDEQAFWQIVRAEKERADRSGLPVTVAVFTVKDDDAVHGALAGWNAASLCQVLRETARITDHVGVAGPNELGVLLWGTRELGAYRFVNRLGEKGEWLAERCNLFVYPELKPVDLSTELDSSEEDNDSEASDNSIPPGILRRIAEVERQLARAAAVETPTDNGHEFDDFGEQYSFGADQDVDTLLEEIQQTTQTQKPPARKSDQEEDRDDDDDQTSPPSFEQSDTPPAVSASMGSGDDSKSNGNLALLTETHSSVKQKQAPIKPKPAPARKISRKQAVQKEFQKAMDGDLDVELEPLENLFLHPFPRWKRAVDVVGAGFGLILLSPLLALIACLIKFTSPGPVLFRQLREGYGGELFMINKFRTMRVGADAEKAALRAESEQDGPAFKLADDPRITKLGSFLRKTCLDELPQLWNVLWGDMTLVGPRPLDHRESQKIARWGRRRLNVMPGLTCIWQVHGKSKVTFNEWMRMDIRYSQRVSFRQDMMLVFATLKQVMLRQASH